PFPRARRAKANRSRAPPEHRAYPASRVSGCAPGGGVWSRSVAFGRSDARGQSRPGPRSVPGTIRDADLAHQRVSGGECEHRAPCPEARVPVALKKEAHLTRARPERGHSLQWGAGPAVGTDNEEDAHRKHRPEHGESEQSAERPEPEHAVVRNV